MHRIIILLSVFLVLAKLAIAAESFEYLREIKVGAIFISSYLLLPRYLKQLQAAKICYLYIIDSSAVAASGAAGEGLLIYSRLRKV